MNARELDRLTAEFRKDKEVKVKARGIVALSLMMFLLSALAVFAGCKGGGGGPTEPSPTIVGTWHDRYTGWRSTFGADGSYRSILYGSSYKIENIGSYRCQSGCQAGDRIRIDYTQNNYTTGASYSDRVSVGEIITLTADTLTIKFLWSGGSYTADHYRVS